MTLGFLKSLLCCEGPVKGTDGTYFLILWEQHSKALNEETL